jgi:hypothetical protein
MSSQQHSYHPYSAEVGHEAHRSLRNLLKAHSWYVSLLSQAQLVWLKILSSQTQNCSAELYYKDLQTQRNCDQINFLSGRGGIKKKSTTTQMDDLRQKYLPSGLKISWQSIMQLAWLICKIPFRSHHLWVLGLAESMVPRTHFLSSD